MSIELNDTTDHDKDFIEAISLFMEHMTLLGYTPKVILLEDDDYPPFDRVLTSDGEVEFDEVRSYNNRQGEYVRSDIIRKIREVL